MFGLGQPKTVAEHEAEGELGRIYHEIRQVLRVNGVNLIFRRLATYRSFPSMWEAIRPVVETVSFFEAADRVRALSVREADGLGRLDVLDQAGLGESQAFQARGSQVLYHDINPRLLVLVSAAILALEGETIGASAPGSGKRVARGVPGTMFPMEMVPEDTDEEPIRSLFDDIKSTLDLPSVNSDYRTLALWPNYLAAIWERLKPIVKQEAYTQAADRLREAARKEARGLPARLDLTRDRIESAGDDPDKVLETLRTFEQLLPPLINNVSLIELDWHDPESLAKPPFPAPLARPGGAR